MARTILVSIPDGIAERLLLTSGVIRRLAEKGNRVVIVTPHANNVSFINEYSHPNIWFEPLKMKVKYPRINYYFTSVWRYSQASKLSPGWQEKLLDLKGIYRIFRLFNTIFKEQEWFFGFLRLLDRRIINKDRYYRDLFDKYEIHLVVTTSDFEYSDRVITRRSLQNGIKTVRAIKSWDNITTRGYFYDEPDFFIVWNRINKEELIKYHNIRKDKVFVCGVPHYDAYAGFKHVDRQKLWREFCEKTGLDKEKKLIFVCGSVQRSGWMLNDIMEILVDAIQKGEIMFPSQILFRPHPQVISGYSQGPGKSEDIEYYKSLSDNVHIDLPQVIEGDSIFRLWRDDIVAKAERLFLSDVVINFYSTIQIEAAALDTPIINIGFDGKDNSHLIRRFEDFYHLKAILRTGGVRVATSHGNLIEIINAYLDSPDKDRVGRQRIVENHMYRNDGQASRRMADVIEHVALFC